MRDRRFPNSFWVQPQRPSCNVHETLPLHARGTLLETRTTAIRIPTPPDTNLLFSLFKILEHRQHHQIDMPAALVDAAKGNVETVKTTAAALSIRCDRSTKRSAVKRRDRHHPQRRRRLGRVATTADNPRFSVASDAATGAGGTTTVVTVGLPDVVADAQHAYIGTTTTTMMIPNNNGNINHHHHFAAIHRDEDDEDNDVDDIVGRVHTADVHRGDHHQPHRHRHLSAQDPYLAGRRRSLLMLIGDRAAATRTAVATAEHHNQSSTSLSSVASASAVASVGSSCYSDLLSDLVVNL